LSGKKAFVKSDVQHEVVLVDATEMPCEQKKKQHKWYSGKKKRHTRKCRCWLTKRQANNLHRIFGW
jgi:hypothetical protein